jgi:hypothetical protein
MRAVTSLASPRSLHTTPPCLATYKRSATGAISPFATISFRSKWPKLSCTTSFKSPGERRRHHSSGHLLPAIGASHRGTHPCIGFGAREWPLQRLDAISLPPSSDVGECRATCISPFIIRFFLLLTSKGCSSCCRTLPSRCRPPEPLHPPRALRCHR